MVKIIEKTKEERELEKKVKNLFDITSKIIGKEPSQVENSLRINQGIYVHCNLNLICASEKKYFDSAYELAEAYEKETGEKWALKQGY